jgi:hypothetical protein
MALRKAILDIDLGGEKLKQALETLRSFRAVAASIPAAVSNARRAVVQAVSGSGVPAAAGGTTPTAEERRETRDAEQRTRRLVTYWQTIGASIRHDISAIRDVGKTLQGYTGALLRWTGIATAVQGVALGGSIWGLERLASAAYAGRRSSSGLGIGYGSQQAFGLAYERLINSGGLLQGVSQARGNLTSEAAGSLYSLGIDPTTAKGDTGDVAKQVLMRVRQLAQQTPESELGVLMQNYRLGEHGFDVESLRRLKTAPDSEFDRYTADYERRRRQLDIQDETLRRWQDLDVQLEATASKLKNSLLVGLEKLAEPIGKVSEALSDFIQSISKSSTLQTGLAYLAKQITVFGDYIGRDEFKTDVKLFVESVSVLAEKTVAALRWLNLIPDPNAAPGNGTPGLLQNNPNHWMYRPPGGSKYNGTVEGSPVIAPTRAETRVQRALGIWDAITAPFTGGKSPEIDNYLRAIRMIESGSEQGDYGIVNKTSGAIGAYQIMPANVGPWSKRYLGHEMTPEELRLNPGAQDAIARARWEEMIRKYGNPQDAASEWHSGVDLRTAIAQGRNDKGTGGGMYTSEYVNQFNRNLARQGVSININNNTGGNATVTVAPLGVGSAY